MLPFSLKVIWFCLSLTGSIVCWIVLSLFARATGIYWGPMLYSIFATLLQVIFCLGMVYDMNPFRMPKTFCTVQTVLIYYFAWSLTGVCAAFTFATTTSVLWPSSYKRPAATTLAWKYKYCFPIFVFPLACLAISLPILLRFHAIQPTDDLHCDASHPEWGRFLGYAGFSMVLTIPCLFITAFAAYRVYQLHNDLQRSRFSAQPTVDNIHSRSLARISNGGDIGMVKSPASPSDMISPYADPELSYSPQLNCATSNADMRGPLPDAYLSVPSSATPKTPLTSQKRTEAWEDMYDAEEANHRRQLESLSSMTRVALPPPPNLVPAIWRLIIFQMAFFVIQCLAALSTVIDVVRHRPTPTPFGSQHIALILVGWGPAFVFGHLPAVRRQLMFWKK